MCPYFFSVYFCFWLLPGKSSRVRESVLIHSTHEQILETDNIENIVLDEEITNTPLHILKDLINTINVLQGI